jgi:membrane protease YdiL (CAAX protease family)
MREKQHTHASVVAFVALAAILSWTCWLPLVLLYPAPSTGERSGAVALQQLLGGYGPSLAALLMALFDGRGELRRLLARLRRRRAWTLPPGALLLPFALLVPALFAYALQGGRLASLPWKNVLPTLVLSIFVSGLGEELGWRGYLLPRLQAQFGPLAASVAIGLIWAGWHLPVYLWSATQAGAALLIEYALYTLILTAFSIVFTRVYNCTGGKLWPVVLLHAAVTATGNSILVALSPGQAGTWTPYLVYVLSACGVAAWIALGEQRGVRRSTTPGKMPSTPTAV